MVPARTLLAAVLAALAIAPASGAHGGAIVNTALEELRSGDPVFVHPQAVPTLRSGEIERLRNRIVESRGRVYVAVLPAAAAHELGSAVAVLRAVRDGIGLDGTYAVVVGGVFGAATQSGELGKDRAAGDAQAALRAHGGGSLASVLTDFVDRTASSSDTAADGSFPWAIVVAVAAVLGLGSLGLLATLARARRRSSVG